MAQMKVYQSFSPKIFRFFLLTYDNYSYLNIWISVIWQDISGFYPSTFLQRFSFFTVCLFYYFTIWNLGLQVAGKCISDTVSECRSIAFTSLISMFFSVIIMVSYVANERKNTGFKSSKIMILWDRFTVEK